MKLKEIDAGNAVEVANKYDGFAKYIGIEVLEAQDGYAKAQIKLDERHFNPIGSIHGGVIFALADTVSGVAVHRLGKYCTTLSSTISYLRAAMQGKSQYLYAEAKPIRIGRTICVMDVLVTDDLGKEIAKLTVEFYILAEQ